MNANFLYLHTHLIPGVRSNVNTVFFSENGHVAYQIKGNEAYNNVHANILPSHTLSIHGIGSIIFSECSHVAYQVKEIEA